MPVITVFLYDAENRLIGLMYTYGDSIAVGETSAEEVTGFSLPDGITSSDVDHFEVIAYPTQFQL